MRIFGDTALLVTPFPLGRRGLIPVGGGLRRLESDRKRQEELDRRRRQQEEEAARQRAVVEAKVCLQLMQRHRRGQRSR